MMRPPRTIKGALLTGFLVIFAVWLASTSYFTGRLADTEERNAAIHARYARAQELLFAVRSQVLLGSIYVRDALIEVGESPTAAAVARDQLRALQAQVHEELEQYKAIDSGDDTAGWTQLEGELHDYWDAAVLLAAPEADNQLAIARARLLGQVIPRRDVILAVVGRYPPGDGRRPSA